MALYPKPHSSEWFAAMDKFNPHQAACTKEILNLAGSLEVCSICGDSPAGDYQLSMRMLAADAVATIRLCDDCLGIQKNQGEVLLPFSGPATDSSRN